MTENDSKLTESMVLRVANRVQNKTLAMGTVGGSAALTTYLAGLAAAKWGIPLEIAALAVGALMGYAGRWAAKLDPENFGGKQHAKSTSVGLT